ncbi:MAG TPA: hypothetical protein PKN47_22410 [Nitrospira sp.]|jgi:hypothetical protein|nr:hypothetical protein [Nitrospira sp.]
MVKKAEVLKLVHGHVSRVLLVAQASLPLSQFQAFRTVVLNEFGRNGLEGELERLEYQLGAEERNGMGRNT